MIKLSEADVGPCRVCHIGIDGYWIPAGTSYINTNDRGQVGQCSSDGYICLRCLKKFKFDVEFII